MKRTAFYIGAMALALGGCGEADQIGTDELTTTDVVIEAAYDIEKDTMDTFEATGLVAKTMPELATALASGETTAVQLTQAYLNRIEAVNLQGPELRAVLTLNPDALEQAVRSDARWASGSALGPLDGLPILLKDNIESLDPMPTTAGALALKDNVTGRDSPLVAGLRAQGAVILGKTNLSQWANFRSEGSNSGWSALGGQVLNPHVLNRNPCGSSSGSGVAAAASLAAGTVGTETNGSIICPSNVNGIVGFKPTVGLVSATHIIPISPSQDTAGPMTKTVTGAAMMLGAMANGDTDYAAQLSANSLKNTRIGVLRFAQGSDPLIIARFDAALADMEAAGAELVTLDAQPPLDSGFWGYAFLVLKYEFKASLNRYLASTPDTVTTRTLADVIAFNQVNAEIELAPFDQGILEASEALGPLTSPDYQKALEVVQTATRTNGIDKLLADNTVDVLVAPSGPISPQVDYAKGDVWPEWAGLGWAAAIAGYPHITVPMGTVEGVPLGVSFIGAQDQDAALLSYGYAYEQISQRRVAPEYRPSVMITRAPASDSADN